MIPEILLLVKQIRPGRTEIDDFGASVAILLQSRALKAVKCIADAFPAADNTLILVISEGALIADANESRRTYVGVTDRTFAVAFITESSEGDACLLAAHDEIGVVARHSSAEVREEKFDDVLKRLYSDCDVSGLLRQRRGVGNARRVLKASWEKARDVFGKRNF